MIALLRLPDLRAFLVSAALASFAENALSVILGVHVYALAQRAIALGWLGLAEAVPAIGLVLIGGHVADRVPRLRAAIAARAGLAVLATLLAAGAGAGLAWFYALAFLIGCVRAFEDPAVTGLEAEILPRGPAMMNAVSLVASAGRVAGLLGPVLGGIAYEYAGPRPTFVGIAILLAASAAALPLGIVPRPAPPRPEGEGAIAAIAAGLRYVFASQVIVGSMALDLFAVFFGGVTGLLPAFVAARLDEGPAAVGLLRAAASAGALAAMLVATRHPPRARAGLALHLAVAGFGLGIIVFGLSTSLAVCMAALAFAGACDGISVIVRRAIIRIAAPDALRGRVAAVRGLFLNASNELGTFESGIAAALLGVAPAVWAGGLVTLAVAAITAWRAPELRRLDLTRLGDAHP
jgi:MFS family permease